MKMEILPEARQELFDAVDYYEQKQLGLGKRFYTEIVEICSMILEHPLLWREQNASFRRTNCPVFPYYIAYFIRENVIVVAAVAHSSRHPNYWKDRLD
jgi:plasmid stabilization system protein ParE